MKKKKKKKKRRKKKGSNHQYQRGKASGENVIDPKIFIASNLKFNKLPFNKAQH